jgi:hypothetical protein
MKWNENENKYSRLSILHNSKDQQKLRNFKSAYFSALVDKLYFKRRKKHDESINSTIIYGEIDQV